MSKIESKIGKINRSDKELYNFLGNFNNFEHLLPKDKISDWESDGESCSFSIEGLGNAGLKFIEKEEYSLLKISSDGSTPITFFMWIQFKSIEEGQTAVKITVDPQVNVMMMGMVKKPLQEFVDMLIDQIQVLEF